MANHPNRSRNKIREAREGAQPAFDRIIQCGGRCMEQVADKANGILVERWLLPNCVSVVVYATPTWRDVFLPGSAAPSWEAALDAISAAASIDTRSNNGT